MLPSALLTYYSQQEGHSDRRIFRFMKYFSRLMATLCAAGLAGVAAASESQLPQPPQLAPAVHFWTRVYTEINTDAGFIHDQENLSVVYETVHFDADSGPRARERQIDAEKQRFHDILVRLGQGLAPASPEEQRVLSLWGTDGTPTRLALAADDVRFQLGQADRFRAGLIRAGVWEKNIAQVLAREGLPPELAALPHVESSFDPAAYSKVGAAGLWQFMRSTGRRFLRINGSVDERLDPFRATEAAAQLLSYDYQLLGSWPLAITAYNHGAEGMLRAREQLGTDDIVRIIREYHSPTFGFASRNYYASFLAALRVSQNPQQYFGSLPRQSEQQFGELRMPSPASVATVAGMVGVDRDTLQQLNPALRSSVWRGRRLIPAGYILRLPASDSSWTSAQLAQRLSQSPRASQGQALLVAAVQRTAPANSSSAVPAAGGRTGRAVPVPLAPGIAAATTDVMASVTSGISSPLLEGMIGTAPVPDQRPPQPQNAMTTAAPLTGERPAPYYLVQDGDTVGSIAMQAGLTASTLMTLNSLPDQDFLYEGERLRLAASVPEPGAASSPAQAALAQQAIQENREDRQEVALASHLVGNDEPVSAAQAQAEGPQLGPGSLAGPQSADPVDYSVASDGSIRVVAAETLGHYADWLGLPAARLRELNHLHDRRAVMIGRRIRLDFSHVSAVQFEQRRRDYHEQLQAAYFAMHRIVGTTVYIAHRGDSLWTINQRNVRLPVWLLQQYNPGLNLTDMKPGTRVSLPRVEEVSAS
jgi:membrane-bound lytic murein transglycosylase D